MKKSRKRILTSIKQKFLAFVRKVLIRLTYGFGFEVVLPIGLYVIFAGFARIFIWLGFSTSVAIALSLILLLLILLVSAIAYTKHRNITNKVRRNSYLRVRGEVKLADNIAQILATKSPREWEEYQDWLHDILLIRRQLLERHCPRWKVIILTYWRLFAFCVIISLIKLKRFASGARKIR
ncbi:MAG: hypothetical protein QNJ70_05280 [Xenococcaceae cyanobacterium MO_207.B15]|nr:hypothetical protein [Xenococcaceae cyanobacterium MO_207.B15]